MIVLVSFVLMFLGIIFIVYGIKGNILLYLTGFICIGSAMGLFGRYVADKQVRNFQVEAIERGYANWNTSTEGVVSFVWQNNNKIGGKEK